MEAHLPTLTLLRPHDWRPVFLSFYSSFMHKALGGIPSRKSRDGVCYYTVDLLLEKRLSGVCFAWKVGRHVCFGYLGAVLPVELDLDTTPARPERGCRFWTLSLLGLLCKSLQPWGLCPSSVPLLGWKKKLGDGFVCCCCVHAAPPLLHSYPEQDMK